MSNKREESYKRVFNSIIEILTQNFIYDLPLKSITTDSEISLINVVEETFLGIQRIGCFYHLKENIENYANTVGLLNENNKYININETRDIIYILGNLCLEYIADMDSFDKEIDNIKRQYNKHYLCLINYFVYE